MNRIRRDDRGVAMVTVLLVTAVLTALGVTVTQVSLSNLGNAGRDRVAGGALGAAEAGVARAISYIHSRNTNAIACSPTCATNPWGNKAAPKVVGLPDGRQASVWIETVQPFAPPTYKAGTYKIHSVGAAGPGKRTLEVTIEVKPMNFPLGIYTTQKLNNGGTAAVFNTTVLSHECIDSRDKMTFTGMDAYYGIPAAAHSTKYITKANIQACDNNLNNVWLNDTKAIHRAAVGTCSPEFPYDQDNAPLGGTFPAGSSCLSAPNQYTTSSLFTSEIIKAEPYNYLPRGLKDSDYALLKARAQALGLYFTTNSPASTAWPNAAAVPNPVVYFKLNTGEKVTLQGELNSYGWQADASCLLQHPGLVLVVEGGDLQLNSNARISGAVFVPDGNMTYNGGAQVVGTVFAYKLHFTGNASVTLNECYTRGTPGGVLDIKPLRFREVDR
ncbi:MAG TPA: pilus assembly PilX N-terminal domain-containing protein [Frankiaceae bacterium]|nr:pilus assembly PilX N-terminal domain-containing protein [Frankiaceae bacterium]